jgi:hypothetical protein
VLCTAICGGAAGDSWQPVLASQPTHYHLEELIRSARMYLIAFSVGMMFLFLRCFHLPWVPFAVNGDELLFFSRALRLEHGQVLYRDIFELVTPGTELLYALGFRIFGVHGWLIESWHIGLGTALCLVITSIARRILSGPAVLLPMLLFLAFDLSIASDATHHWWSTLFSLSAVSVLLRGREPWRITICGGFCGVATLFTQTQGVMVFFAVLVYLAIENHNDSQERHVLLTLFSLPYLALCTAVLGYYCYTAGTHCVFFDLIVSPLTRLTGPMNCPETYLHQLPALHGVFDIIRLVPMLFVLGMVPYCYLLSLYLLWKKRYSIDLEYRNRILLLNLVGLAMFAAICSGPRLFRTCTVAPPALLVFTWHLQYEGRVRRLAHTAIWAVVMSFVVYLPIHRQLQWHRALFLPTGMIALSDTGQWQEF